MSDTASVWVVRSLALVAAVALGSSLGCTFHSAQPSSASGSAVEARSAAAVSQAFAQAWVSGDGAGLAETLCSSGTIPSPIIPLAIAPGKVDNVRLIGVAQHGPDRRAIAEQMRPSVDFHVPFAADQGGATIHGAVEVSLETQGSANACVKGYRWVLDSA